MPLVFPGAGALHRSWGGPPGPGVPSLDDAPVGLLARCKMLTPLFQMRDGGVPRRPGGLPHNSRRIHNWGKNKWHWVNNLAREPG